MTDTEFKVTDVKDKNEWDNLISKYDIVVCDFTATWCGPCKMIGPEFKKLAYNYKNNSRVLFVKIDVDENSEVSEMCEITCMPTFQIWNKGDKVKVLTGASHENLVLIQTTVEKLLKK